MVNAAQTEKLVEARHDAGILEIREPADSHDEFRPAAPLRNFETRLFHVAIRKSEPLANLTQTNARNQAARFRGMQSHEWAGL